MSFVTGRFPPFLFKITLSLFATLSRKVYRPTVFPNGLKSVKIFLDDVPPTFKMSWMRVDVRIIKTSPQIILSFFVG